MRWVSAVLHGIALLLALNVQYLESPLAGAWLPFHLAGCACLLASNDPHPPRTPLWWALLLWTISLLASTFILRPVGDGAATMWLLIAMPTLALCMKRQAITAYATVFLSILFLYAAGLDVQMAMNVHYTALDYGGMLGHTAMAWPLIDPNNAAAVVNLGLIPSFYLALRKPKAFFLVAIFAAALFTTGSKAGMLAGAAGCTFLLVSWLEMNWFFATWTLLIGSVFMFLLPPGAFDPLINSLNYRIPLWSGAAKLLSIHPFTGTGIGTFYYYYKTVRHEDITAGVYAHNDLLQFAIEMGLPIAGLYCYLTYVVARRLPAVGAVTFLVVFVQALVEFQFYLPSINLALGLALAELLWSKDTDQAQLSQQRIGGPGHHYGVAGNNSHPPLGSQIRHLLRRPF